jgi:hypothetical protein
VKRKIKTIVGLFLVHDKNWIYLFEHIQMKTKNIIILLTLIVLLVVTIFGYFHMKNEQKNIKIDEYNFTQLEKFKSALISIQDEDNKVMSLRNFNETFNENIEPAQNCYYISTTDAYW